MHKTLIMTPEQFVYWLQGFLETSNPISINATQTRQIKDHLNLVFEKVTPTTVVETTPPLNIIQPKPYNYNSGPDNINTTILC